MSDRGNRLETGAKQAVAISYDAGQTDAPVVKAKGKGSVADKIVAVAEENGVPVHEDASLVEVLSKIDLDQQIPPDLYQLVAEILSFVYKSDKEALEKLGLKGSGPID